jgi:LysR family transcriptional regulator, glycine cleavage system transcriptional activator
MHRAHALSGAFTLPKPLRKRPISLDNLRGFDAAARYLSFTLAAEELHLTQSSVSRQISALEYDVGQPLFIRKTRALELTPAGHRMARAVRDTLDALDACVIDIRGGQARRRVSVTTFPSFSSLWLIPRLPEFAQIAPDIDLRIDSSEHIVDLAAERIDVAIRMQHENTAPRKAVRLVDDVCTPALSPDLLARLSAQGNRMKTPQDLTGCTLLAMEDRLASSRALNWENWFAAAGVKPGAASAIGRSRIVLNFIDQTMQAAMRGQGVALARQPFLDEFVARGDLIAPFATRLASPYAYYLITNPQTENGPHIQAFCGWLKKAFGVEG